MIINCEATPLVSKADARALPSTQIRRLFRAFNMDVK